MQQQMGRAFVYVIIGGGVAAGYAAHEFVQAGVSLGELCIISEEPVTLLSLSARSRAYVDICACVCCYIRVVRI